MKTRGLSWGVGVIAIIAVLLLVSFPEIESDEWRGDLHPSDVQESEPIEPGHESRNLVGEKDSGPSHPPSSTPGASQEVTKNISDHFDGLKEGDDEKRYRQLMRLKEEMFSQPSSTASHQIRAFLASGQDLDLGMPFAVEEGGTLQIGDTLRVNLLDWLGQIDPVAAAEESQVIYQTKDSPEEWAVALRNTVWGGRLQDQEWEAREEVRVRIVEMLDHEPWRENPTAGYLESFDAVVYSRSREAVAVLMNYLHPEQPDILAAASRRALNHLAEIDGLLLLDTFQKNEWRNIDPMERAWFYAKLADPGPEAQAVLKTYVQSVSQVEAEEFLRLYPNFSRGYSHSLLTPFHTTRGATFAQLEQFSRTALAPLVQSP